jgi:hypothetical protein
MMIGYRTVQVIDPLLDGAVPMAPGVDTREDVGG